MNLNRHPLVLAAAVQTVLEHEMDWLKIAKVTYPSDRFRRLVTFSGERLRIKILDLGLDCGPVTVTPAHPTAPVFAVDIAWRGDLSEGVLRAWRQILNPDAKC